jgi:putative FmdB family regulatory protein
MSETVSMPTYDYTCLKCGHGFECVQSMRDPALETCPKEHCPRPRWGKGPVKRGVGGGAGLIFKGSGFYITDYRSESYKSAAKQEGSAGKSSGSAGEGAAKPASTPPAAAPSAPKSDTK